MVNEFLLLVYRKYKEENGDSMDRLKFYKFSRENDSLFDGTEYQGVQKRNRSFDTLTSKLSRELDALGYVKISNLEFTLTPEGYTEALRLLHPVVYFIYRYWKWYIPIVVGVVVAILTAK